MDARKKTEWETFDDETPDVPAHHSDSVASPSYSPPSSYTDPSQYPPISGMPYLQHNPEGIPALGNFPDGQRYNQTPEFLISSSQITNSQSTQPQQQQQQQRGVLIASGQHVPDTVDGSSSALRQDVSTPRVDSAAPPFYSLPPPYNYPSQSPPAYGASNSQQYPRQIPSAPQGQRYYPNPGFIYPGQQTVYSQNPSPQQQQQQRVVIVDGQDVPIIADGSSSVSMTGAIVLACLVTWLCASKCGIWAFRLAWFGRRLAAAGETQRALYLRRESYRCSIVGIVVGIVIIIALVCYFTLRKPSLLLLANTTFRPPITYKTTFHYPKCYNKVYGYYYYC